jgi:enoyl-CoA hydratase/carnithine racemase
VSAHDHGHDAGQSRPAPDPERLSAREASRRPAPVATTATGADPGGAAGARGATSTRTYHALDVHRDGPVGWIVFDRPERGNAMDATMLDELEAAWQELDADPAVRVIVNTGNGPAFQTGLDVAQLARDPAALRKQSRRTRDAELKLTAWHNQVWKPVVAAVNGVCAGGGLHFVADADIVIAAADATFLDPHVSLGQVSAYEMVGLVRKSPMEPIARMALVGRHERVDARRARQLGILSEVVDPPVRLWERAQELAETIARNSPAAMAATKRALWGALEVGLTEASRRGARELVGMWGHPDQTEGPSAWVDRRSGRSAGGH